MVPCSIFSRSFNLHYIFYKLATTVTSFSFSLTCYDLWQSCTSESFLEKRLRLTAVDTGHDEVMRMLLWATAN